MKYHFRIHKEKESFWAECIELPGCITQADSIEELCDNMEKALNLYIEEPKDCKVLAPFPDPNIATSKTVVEVPLAPTIAFAFLVRYYRLKHGLTQQCAAQMIGFSKIYSYQRLETKRCNPSLRTISKIKEVFPEFSLDFALSS